MLSVVSLSKACDSLTMNHPVLTAIIDELPLSNEHILYQLEYAEDEVILDKGFCQFLLESRVDSETARSEIHDELAFNGLLPMFVVAEGMAEIGLNLGSYYLPVSVIPAGHFSAVQGVLDPTLTFMVPRVWKITQRVSASGQSGSRIILFPKSWWTNKSNPLWEKFYAYLIGFSWERSAFWMNKWTWDAMIKASFAEVDPFCLSFAKHLLAVTCGKMAAFLTEDKLGMFKLGVSNSVVYCPLNKTATLDHAPMHYSHDEQMANGETILALLQEILKILSSCDEPIRAIHKQVEFSLQEPSADLNFGSAFIQIRKL